MKTFDSFNFKNGKAMKMMRLVLALGALVFALEGQGQGWLKTYGGEGVQGGYTAITMTSENGFFIFTQDISPSHPPLAIKLNSDGDILFEKNVELGLNDNYYPADIKQLNDGGFIIIGSINYEKIHLLKIDSTAEVLWQKIVPIENYPDNIGTSISITAQGDFIISGTTNPPFEASLLLKTNSEGQKIWQKHLSTTSDGIDYYGGGKNLLHQNSIFLLSSSDSTVSYFFDVLLTKTDSTGGVIWAKKYGSPSLREQGGDFIKCSDGGFLIAGGVIDDIAQNMFPFAAKVNENGEEIWWRIYDDFSENATFLSLTPSLDGAYLLSGFKKNTPNGTDILMMKIDENGEEIWRKIHDFTQFEDASSIFQFYDGSIRISGDIRPLGTDFDVFLAKADANGNIFTSALTGSIHLDPQSDCLPDPTESALANWLVQATGNLSFATLTDANGHFTLPVDTGSYQVTVTPPGPYWDVCNSPASVTISAFYDTLTLDFPVQADEECPYLEVDISAPFLRRCFDNTYSVHSCNYGTVTAEDAYVEVTLDPYLTYQSSTIPFSTQNGNTLSFDLGDVAVNECDDFQITAYLDCDSTVLGQTHCTEAHIFPDSLCIPTNAAWDGSSIEVDVECAGDSVLFIITNTGTGNMAQPLDYIIIEDQIVLLQGNFQLNAGQSTTVSAEAEGTTLHLEAQQSPEHPSGTASVGATIEGCGGWMSLGFFIQWPTNNPNPFVDVDCQPNIGSYDPNDKTAFPEGFTEQHLIEPGTDIEYLLRFQNTGTDTAFKVVVVDVLPPELDLATVRPGASSHPYTYSVSPEGWLVFTFENILLPDSTTNEPASNGFVRFRVSQRPGLASGDTIPNTALIYFDFNAPIQTNTTLHRIGQIFPWTLVGTTPPVFSPKNQIRILPNPLTDSALLQVEGIEPGNLHLVLTNTTGQVLREERTFGTGFEFRRGELASGVYFFKIEKDGKWVGSGKLMVW